MSRVDEVDPADKPSRFDTRRRPHVVADDNGDDVMG